MGPARDGDAVQDFVVISDPETLRSLAHKERLAVLRSLVAGPKTGAQVSVELGIPANRAHYQIGRLLECGLVRQVGTGRRRWTEERLFAATARHFIVDPAIGGADLETARALLQATEHSFLSWRRRELLRLDLGALADKIVRDCLRVQAGEEIVAIFGGPSLELGEAVIAATEAAGGRATVRLWSRSVVVGILDRNDEEALREFRLVDPAVDERLSAVVLLSTAVPQGSPPTPEQMKRLPLLMESVSRWHGSIHQRGIRYLEVALPHRSLFGGVEATPEQGLDAYWRVLDSDYAALKGRGPDLLRAVAGETLLRITDDRGTSLEVPIAPGRALVNDGVPEAGRAAQALPAGSVVFLPVAGSARGTLHARYTLVGGVHALDVRATIEAGRIVDIEADTAGDLLRERLAAAAGDAAALATVGFGLNASAYGTDLAEAAEGPARGTGGGGHAGRADAAAGERLLLSGLPALDCCLEGVVFVGFGNNELIGGDVRSTLDLSFPLNRASLQAGSMPLVIEGRVSLPPA